MRRIIIAITLIFLLVLAFDLYPGLRGGGGWQWPYGAPRWEAVLPLALILVVYVVGALAFRHALYVQRFRHRLSLVTALGLLWTVIGGTAIGYAVVNASADTSRYTGDALFHLFARTVSPVQTGAATVAQIMARDGVMPTLQRWPDVMREARDANIIHFTTSPPGQALLHYGTARLLDNTPAAWSLPLRAYQCADLNVMQYSRGDLLAVGVWGLAMPFWAALTAIPLYFAVSAHGHNHAALTTAQWWALIPSVWLFLPTWNTFYPLLVVTAFAFLTASDRYSILPIWMLNLPNPDLAAKLWHLLAPVAAGWIMSYALFLNFSLLPVLFLFGLYVLLSELYYPVGGWYDRAYQPLERLKAAVVIGSRFGFGLISLWLVFWLNTGFSPLEIWQTGFNLHKDLVSGRSYWEWLLLNPYDSLWMIGLPLVLPALVLGIKSLIEAGIAPFQSRKFSWQRYALLIIQNAHPLIVAVVLMIFVVNLSGNVQGENARILIFYAPFVLLITSLLFVGQKTITPDKPLTSRVGYDTPLFLAQACCVLVLGSVLRPIPLDMNPPPAAPFEYAMLLGDPRPLDATFTGGEYAGEFQLANWRVLPDPGQQVMTITLEWHTLSQIERPYLFELSAEAPHPTQVGEIIRAEPLRWYPQNGNYLTTCWQPGTTLNDVVTLPLPEVPAPVVWTVTLRVLDERTSATTTPDSLTLGDVNYP